MKRIKEKGKKMKIKTFETQRNRGRGGMPKNLPRRHGDTEKKKPFAADLRG
jgi:hypothetical protein